MSEQPSRSSRVSFDEAEFSIDAEEIRNDYLEKLFCQQGKFPAVATLNDQFLALSSTVRDRLLARWVRSAETFFERESRTVAYLSTEFLLGPQLSNNLLLLGMRERAKEALAPLRVELDTLIEHEEEPGLGNGGLGRLAACYMDSLATLDIPAIGYGIRYEHGIFDQVIRDGRQVELPDKWLRLGNPWEIPRPEIRYQVGFGGSTHHEADASGRYHAKWTPERVVNGTPYDTAVLGHGTNNANFVRLWKAVASEEFDFEAFNAGDYSRAVDDKMRSETITKVLYPNDSGLEGKRLRLEQQYLLVSCSLQDMIRLALQRKVTLAEFHRKFAAQLNDTHPALAVVELMRLLVDVHGMEWAQAWDITVATFGYTNHTLLPEALETWGVPLFGSLLPRHLELIYEINRRFLEQVRAKYPGDEERTRRLSLIDESGQRSVRMAHLAAIGSHAINGVAELHSRLLRETVLRDFAELYPERFHNVTNGVTPRRFIALANPELARLIDSAIGDGWLRDLERLRALEPLAQDAAFAAEFRRIKQRNKRALSEHVRRATGLVLDPEAMFDIQVKRMHEYKRQLLNLLHVITQYQRIRAGRLPQVRRAFVFAGKAAPGYFMAKLVIRLIHDVADALRRDRAARDWLSVVFVPDFNVKVAEHIYPAAELSEQISLAGKEASGTGNMKLAMNGALTIGTLDGANIEIRERVGAENFYMFGLDAAQAQALRREGYQPNEVAQRDPELRAALELIASGHFSAVERDRYAPLVDSLLGHDEYMVLADFRAYVDTHQRVHDDYRDTAAWTARAIRTVARMGYFSSDRSVAEYCRNIWHVGPVPIEARAR